jgi:uncharacterized membrane protein YqiK
MARLDKERAMAESRAKDISAAERAKLQAASEEARKEGAVQRALADGWARDIKVRGVMLSRLEVADDL